jgi:hypothetical protein
MALAYDSERLQESRFRDPWLGRTRQWRWQQATLPGSRAGTTQKAPATARSFSRLSCCRHARSWRGHRLWAARRHDHGGGRGQPCSPVPSGAPAGATAILCLATGMRSSLTWGGHHDGRHAGPPGRHDRCTQAPVQVPTAFTAARMLHRFHARPTPHEAAPNGPWAGGLLSAFRQVKRVSTGKGPDPGGRSARVPDRPGIQAAGRHLPALPRRLARAGLPSRGGGLR